MWFWLIVILGIAGIAYVRYGRSDPVDWHVDPLVTANQDLVDGVRRRVADAPGLMERLHLIALETPRTEVLAGSVEEGHITYVTRSRWMGFPDYATVKRDDGQLEIWSRLRFGKTDMGVNKARIDGWLQRLSGDGTD